MAIGGTMMAISVVSGLAGAAASVGQAGAIRAQGAYEQDALEESAQWEEWRSKDALERGDLEGSKAKLENKAVIGSQRAGYASQGVDVNSGSAAQVQASTAGVGAMDVATIKTNAWRESLGFTKEAENLRRKKELSKMATENQANQTMIGGGLGFLSSVGNGFGFLKGK